MSALTAEQPPRDHWAVEVITQRSDHPYFTYVEYALKDTRSGEPFLFNDHKMQLRENHQRIKRDDNGKLLHVSGVALADEDVAAFLANDVRAYRWKDRDRTGNWRDDRGRTLGPYLWLAAPWAGVSVDELDPQWQRETHILPLADQITDCIARYQDLAASKLWTGDRRGTTLNLQVGASGNDGEWSIASSYLSATTTIGYVGNLDPTFPALHNWYRFTSVSGLSGATITAATVTLVRGAAGSGSPLTALYADDQTAPGAPSTAANGEARTLTTAKVDWDSALSAGSNVSPSVVSVIQELADSYDPTVIQILHRNDGSLNAAYMRPQHYDGSSSNAPKLDITYTAAAGTTRLLASLGVGT